MKIAYGPAESSADSWQGADGEFRDWLALAEPERSDSVRYGWLIEAPPKRLDWPANTAIDREPEPIVAGLAAPGFVDPGFVDPGFVDPKYFGGAEETSLIADDPSTRVGWPGSDGLCGFLAQLAGPRSL